MQRERRAFTAVFLFLVGSILLVVAVAGWNSHELVLGRPRRSVPHESVHPRSKVIRLQGWSADVARLGLATLGLLFPSYVFCANRRLMIRNNMWAILLWAGVSMIYVAGQFILPGGPPATFP